MSQAAQGREGWPRGEERDWCLFLDRDGVINTRVVGDYVRSWEQFDFLPGAVDALRSLSAWAPHLVVVTNQQGVGKGLMTSGQLADVHARMTAEVVDAGGRIDEVLTCEHLEADNCACRKPAAGMVTGWLERHPEVRVERSVVVGDAPGDMLLGRAVGAAKCVWIGEAMHEHADVAFASLGDFAHFVETQLTFEEAS